MNISPKISSFQLRSAVFALLLALALASFSVDFARADAADPILASTTGSVLVNGDGSRTVTVQGGWAWTTRATDCNNDKRAVGYAVDWNDPDQAGNLVTTLPGPVPVDVGVAADNSYNLFDNLVHATPAATDSTDVNVWRGGCGTYSAIDKYNSGTWGPISHTYGPAFLGTVNVCALMYDVHLSANAGKPSSADEIKAGLTHHNDDNSAQKNSGTPLGNGCFTATLKAAPALSSDASASVETGQTISDVAHLSGGFNPTGSIDFKLYGPDDATCANPAIDSTSVTVSGNGDYVAPAFTTTAAGVYRWVASYSGDANNDAVSGSCNDDNESVTVTPPVVVPPEPTPPVTPPVGPPPAVVPVVPQVAPSVVVQVADQCVKRSLKIKPAYSNGTPVSASLYVDGKLVKTVTSASPTFKVSIRKYKAGSHKTKIVVNFSNGSQATVSGSFAKCAAKITKQVKSPNFTG
ncbi:MAG: hypothetical protein JHC87_03230 [Thermoleophilaceae bacterium]|nr:hypothetical protein [Thermoleophilaceae bacterium]